MRVDTSLASVVTNSPLSFRYTIGISDKQHLDSRCVDSEYDRNRGRRLSEILNDVFIVVVIVCVVIVCVVIICNATWTRAARVILLMPTMGMWQTQGKTCEISSYIKIGCRRWQKGCIRARFCLLG